ncbi:glutathione S-transferase L3-like protein isoform X1 [Tanacetum coccineum]
MDFAYIPFVERFQIFLQEVFEYDISSGRPKLATWIEELNKIDTYVETKGDPEHVIQLYKKRFMVRSVTLIYDGLLDEVPIIVQENGLLYRRVNKVVLIKNGSQGLEVLLGVLTFP